MSLIPLFIQQRRAFEEAYQSDDWRGLEPFLHPDMTYEVINMPFHCVIEGRQAVIAGLRKALDNFDRQCVREISPPSQVSEEGNKVITKGHMSFRRGDSPVLEATCWEISTFSDGKMIRLLDLYEAGDAARFEQWMTQWGEGLDASYV